MEPVAQTSEPVVAAENEEATEACSGVLFDRFVEYRELIAEAREAGVENVSCLAGDVQAMDLPVPSPGDPHVAMLAAPTGAR